MKKPTLYLMLGYPGAGKTTISKLVHELTGATHLWADRIRSERYKNPTHSHRENLELYDYLNEMAAKLLAAEQSVIFDTNFNFYKDRKYLSDVAKKHNAKTLIIWVTTDKNTAKKRATKGASESNTRILGDMPPERFEKISRNLEVPRKDESVVEVVGKNITLETVKKILDSRAN